jgi:hypothetical protein
MPGPPPKDPAVRQRRNKMSTTAQLPPESACRRRRVPPLPERFIEHIDAEGNITFKPRPWHPATCAWWTDTWRSPQATQWTKAMFHEVLMLAELRERWQLTGEAKDAAEYRMHRRDFGLTTLDMRRLQWSIEDEAEPKKKAARIDAGGYDAPDPRGVLRAVK